MAEGPNIDDIFIEIRARLDKLEGDLTQAERMVDNRVQRINQATDKTDLSLRTIGRSITRLGVGFVGIRVGMEGVNSVLGIGIGLMEAFSNNIEESEAGFRRMRQTAEGIPFVGGLFRAGGQTLRDLAQMNPMVSMGIPGAGLLNALTAPWRNRPEVKHDQDRVLTMTQDLGEIRKSFERQRQLAEADTPDKRARLEATFAKEDLRAEIRRIFNDMVKAGLIQDKNDTLFKRLKDTLIVGEEAIDAELAAKLRKKEGMNRDLRESVSTAIGTARLGPMVGDVPLGDEGATESTAKQQVTETKKVVSRLDRVSGQLAGMGFN